VERAMFAFLTKLLLILRSRLRSQARLQAEILVRRQQVLILGRQSPSRERLRNLDRVILVWLYRVFPTLLSAITVVKPETVVRWHRRGFGAYCQ
jgi:putative transposase